MDIDRFFLRCISACLFVFSHISLSFSASWTRPAKAWILCKRHKLHSFPLNFKFLQLCSHSKKMTTTQLCLYFTQGQQNWKQSMTSKIQMLWYLDLALFLIFHCKIHVWLTSFWHFSSLYWENLVCLGWNVTVFYTKDRGIPFLCTNVCVLV